MLISLINEHFRVYKLFGNKMLILRLGPMVKKFKNMEPKTIDILTKHIVAKLSKPKK